MSDVYAMKRGRWMEYGAPHVYNNDNDTDRAIDVVIPDALMESPDVVATCPVASYCFLSAMVGTCSFLEHVESTGENLRLLAIS